MSERLYSRSVCVIVLMTLVVSTLLLIGSKQSIARGDDPQADEPFSAEFLAEIEKAKPGFEPAADRTSPDLDDPVRLEVNGRAIDMHDYSNIAHAGPCYGDVDGDGDRDLLVGDFPGQIHLFRNEGSDKEPRFAKGELLRTIDGNPAKTPVY